MARIRISSAQQLYVAFYGRPGDPSGLAFWDTQVSGSGQTNYAGIAEAFGNSTEAVARFGSLSFPDAVNTLFNSILGRDADPAGLNFFVGELNAGRITLAGLALAIVEGIEEGSSDAATFNNKVLTANRFTAALDTPQELALYDFQRNPISLQIALDLLDNVTSNPRTVPTPLAIQQVVNSLAPQNPPPVVDPVDPPPVVNPNNPPQVIEGISLIDETTLSFTVTDSDSQNLVARIGNTVLGAINNGTETILKITPQSSFLAGRLVVFDGINSTDLGVAIGIGTNFRDDVIADTDSALIYGFGGNDELNGSSSDDFIAGGDGNDGISGREGNDLIDGGDGNDVLLGDDGDDIIFGGSGDDDLAGGSGNDFISGGDGVDVITGGLGRDSLTGGADTDIFVYSSSNIPSFLNTPLSRAIALGGDVISDFQGAGTLGGDVISISRETFELNLFGSNSSNFTSVANDSLVDQSNFKLVFSRATGNLFYNDSSFSNDFTLLVTLQGVNNLTVDDFQFGF